MSTALRFFWLKSRRALARPDKVFDFLRAWAKNGSFLFPVFFVMQALVNGASLSREGFGKLRPYLRILGVPYPDLVTLRFFLSDFDQAAAELRICLREGHLSRRIISPSSTVVVTTMLAAMERLGPAETKAAFAAIASSGRVRSKDLFRELVETFRHGGTARSAFPGEQVEKVARVFIEFDPDRFEIVSAVEPEADASYVDRIELLPERYYTFDDPEVFGAVTPAASRSARVPAFRVYRFQEASVGNARMVLQSGKYFLLDEGAIPDHYGVAGQREFLLPVDSRGVRCVHDRLMTDGWERLDRAFLLSGRVPKNYFHWLIEYAPKLMAVRDTPRLNRSDLPIIIDGDLPVQVVEALRAIAAGARIVNPFLSVNRSRRLEVGELWAPTNPMRVPDRFDLPSWELGGISPEHVAFLRESLAGYFAHPSPVANPRVFLARRSKLYRGVRNADAIQKLFRRAGFVTVHPEDLSFAQQVALFHHSEIIAGAGGAGFSNAVFSRPGARLACFVSNYNQRFPIFANLARSAGARFEHLVGTSVRLGESGVDPETAAHSDYRVDPVMVERWLAGATDRCG